METKFYKVKIGECRGVIVNDGEIVLFMSSMLLRQGGREVPHETANNYNRQSRLTRAVIEDDGTAFLVFELPVGFGVKEDQVVDWLKTCETRTKAFVEFIK